jgi:hypothetical protein
MSVKASKQFVARGRADSRIAIELFRGATLRAIAGTFRWVTPTSKSLFRLFLSTRSSTAERYSQILDRNMLLETVQAAIQQTRLQIGSKFTAAHSPKS